jgi:hypothetical protein
MAKHWEVTRPSNVPVEITTDEIPPAVAEDQVMADVVSDNDTDVINSGNDIRVDDLLEGAASLGAKEEPKVKQSSMGARVANLKDLKVKESNINFNDMTEEAAYDLDLPIVAKPFSNEDSLDVSLKDTSYVARWVNVNPMRLGAMKSRGFIFVVEADLAKPLNIEIEVDAQGHYRCNDVVLMRITKERYYGALRAAHLRAISAVSATGAHKAAASVANQYMEKEAGGEFVDYAARGKVRFYGTGG